MSGDSSHLTEIGNLGRSLPNHHYVPKFILKNFASAKSGNKVALYDKELKRVELRGVKQAATEPGYNTQGNGNDALEQFLSREVETPAAAAVASLAAGTPLSSLCYLRRLALRKLLIAQVVRSPRARKTISAMVESEPVPGSSSYLDFDESGGLTRDGQLLATAALLRAWKELGPAHWPLKVASCGDPATPLFVPDNGVLLHHPDLRSRGWVDSSIGDMASVVMPLSPTLALITLNPNFSFQQSMPAWREMAGLIWGQADRFIYGRREDEMHKKFSTMTSFIS